MPFSLLLTSLDLRNKLHKRKFFLKQDRTRRKRNKTTEGGHLSALYLIFGHHLQETKAFQLTQSNITTAQPAFKGLCNCQGNAQLKDKYQIIQSVMGNDTSGKPEAGAPVIHDDEKLKISASNEVSIDEPCKGAEGDENYHGIDTRAIHFGSNEAYERKVAIMNQALIDLGMGSFQWKVFAMTGFGWFVDNVSFLLLLLSNRGFLPTSSSPFSL